MQKGGIRNPYFDRSLKYKNEVPVTTFSFLFSEMIQYIMTKHNEDKELDLEEKLSRIFIRSGQRSGQRTPIRQDMQRNSG